MTQTPTTREGFPVHPDRVALAEAGILPVETLSRLTEFYKVFGDRTRLRILSCLFGSEMCVCDIAGLLEMNLSAVSHQLRVLKEADLVRCRREGKTVFYTLADDHVRLIFNQGLDHISEKGE